MLQCFQLQGSFANAEFVEVGCEPQDIDETPDTRTHTFLPLSDAVVQMFNSDSQVQERLKGESLLQGFRQHSTGRQENTSAPAEDQFSTHLVQDGDVSANLVVNLASSACVSHAEHPVINAYPAIAVDFTTLRQPQDIWAAHQGEPHGGPAYTPGDTCMQRQPLGIPAFTDGNPIMQQQPCEEPVFSKQGFHVPQPQQQQPHRARARPKQPAGQAIRQQAGSFRAPRPSTGRASKSLPPPPQQAKDAGGFMGIFKTANDAPIDHSRMGMARAAKLLGLEQPNEDILPGDSLPLATCLPRDIPHSFGHVPACALQHDGACPSLVGAPDTEPDQQSAAWAGKAVGSLEQMQCLGVSAADSAQAASGAPPQTAPSAPPAHEGSRLPASSLSQPGHEPDSPADVSSPAQGSGDFVGSAGIAMSPWCDSQLWALASCPQAAQGGQQHGPAQDLSSEPAQDAQVDGDQGLPREAAVSAIEMQDASQHPGSAGQRGTMSGAPVIHSPTQQETPDAAGRGSSPEQHVKPVEAESAQNVPPPAASTVLTAPAGTHAEDGHAAAHEAQSRQGSEHPSEPQQEPCETAEESAAPEVLVKAATEPHGNAEHAHAERGAIPATLPEEIYPEPQESVPASPSLEHADADAQQRSIPATLAEALDENEQRGGVASDSGARMPEEAVSPTEQAILLRSHEVPAPPNLQATIEELCPTVAVEEDVHEGVRLTQQGSDPADSLQAEGLRNGAAATSAPVELASMWSTASGGPLQVSAEAMRAAQALLRTTPEMAPGKAFHAPPPPAEALLPLPESGGPPLLSAASDLPPHTLGVKMKAAAATCGNDISPAWRPPPAAAEAQGQLFTGSAAPVWGTASGKPVRFSREKMAAAAGIFGDELPAALTPPSAGQLQPPPGGAPSLWGTASGKPLEISTDKMAAAAALFGNDFPTALTPPPEAQLQPAHVIVPSLWGTASGKPLEISTDRMAAAAAMFGNDLPIALTPLPPAAADAMATIRWASVPAESSEACKKGVAVAEDVIEAAEPHSVETVPPGSGPLQTLHGSRSKNAMTAAVSTPVLSTAEAGAALLWQTALGKRMRVSSEGLAAAASLLHRTPEPLSADTPQTTAPFGVHGVQHGQADVSGIAVIAEPVHIAGEAASLDPGTPMQLQPAASLGQLSTGTTGRKRSSLLRPQQRPGPTHSKGKGGSCFKAPRKFETPVSKFALQQGCRNATPSRLQQSSTAAPRQPLHNLQGTLAGRLLAEAGYTGSGALAAMCSHPDPAVASMSSRSAASYAVMDPSGGRAEAVAFAQLLHAAGADTEHCSEAWVANHYRWIVWKLACYERRLPQQLAGCMLTLPVVLDQLKYRYEREYGRGQRSVLKKVLEQDERASRAMVLCVAEVLRPSSAQQGGEEQVQLEVTDGWYSVSASIDGPLRHYLASGVLRTGMKLRVCGAELRGGQPETVLEASRSCSLHLHCNGTHRADADAKLGWTSYQSVVVPLSVIRLGGGTAPRTAVVVLRRFPALFWDTLSDGRSLRRTARAKAAADRLAEGQSEKGSEDAVAQIQAEERSHCRQLLAEAKSNNPVPDGAVLYANQILSGESLGELAQQATREDGTKGDRYRAGRDAVMLQRREELMQSGPSVHVTRSNRLLPLLVSPLLPRGASGREQCSMRAIIEVSNPAEDVEALAEGCCCLVTDLSAPAKQRSTGPLLLRTSARTLWQLIPPAEAQTAYSWEHEPRQRARLADILCGLPSPLFDFEGIVLGAGERLRTGGTGQAQQWLFLTDDSIDCFAQSPELACGPRIMAVQLQGQEEAVDFVSPALDVGSIASLRDLQLGVHDVANNLWRAHGTDHTAVQLQPVQSLSRTKVLAGSASQRLAQWALSNQAFIAAMQAAVQRILST